MSDLILPGQPSIGVEGRKLREKYRRLKGKDDRMPAGDLRGSPLTPIISPEHYHLTYTIEGQEIPDFSRAYPRQRPAYLAIFELAESSYPNVAFFDDGQVMIETRLEGRTGRYRLLVAVAACLSTRCKNAGPPIISPKLAPGFSIVDLGRRHGGLS